MSFSRPTLSEIIDRMRTDISSRLTGSATALRRRTIGILAIVFAGAVNLVYGFISYLAKQLSPVTATGIFLIQWGTLKDLTLREATFAELTVEFTGTNGLQIEEDDELVSNDGLIYVVQSTQTVASGVVSVTAVAETEGIAGNLDVDDRLSLSQPIAGINSDGAVTEVVTSGVDEETEDEFRDRVVQVFQNTPQGGAIADYEKWALEVSGVTRAWPLANEPELGTVTLFFVRENDPSSIIPSVGEVAEVQDYIDPLKPVTATFVAAAPVGVVRDFTISISPDTADVRAAVQAELEDLLKREREPGGTLLISKIRESVSTAAGETDNTVSSPNANVVYTSGQIPIMGTITWV